MVWKNWVLFFDEKLEPNEKLIKELYVIFKHDIEEFGIEGLTFVLNDKLKKFIMYIVNENQSNAQISYIDIGVINKHTEVIQKSDYCLFFFKLIKDDNNYLWKLIDCAKENKKVIYIYY